jgi:hypothetical protein
MGTRPRVYTAACKAHLDRVRPLALERARQWRREHPARCSELRSEAAEYSWRTRGPVYHHLSRIQKLGTAASKRAINWIQVRRLRLRGLSWRRVAFIIGSPPATLIGRRREAERA